MKKLLFLVLTCISLLSFISCKNNDVANNSTLSSESISTNTSKKQVANTLNLPEAKEYVQSITNKTIDPTIYLDYKKVLKKKFTSE